MANQTSTASKKLTFADLKVRDFVNASELKSALVDGSFAAKLQLLENLVGCEAQSEALNFAKTLRLTRKAIRKYGMDAYTYITGASHLIPTFEAPNSEVKRPSAKASEAYRKLSTSLNRLQLMLSMSDYNSDELRSSRPDATLLYDYVDPNYITVARSELYTLRHALLNLSPKAKADKKAKASKEA